MVLSLTFSRMKMEMKFVIHAIIFLWLGRMGCCFNVKHKNSQYGGRLIRISQDSFYNQITTEYVKLTPNPDHINYFPPGFDPMELFNISIPSSFSQNSSNIPLSEYNALKDLYNSANGIDWHWDHHYIQSTHWNFTGEHNPCVEQWQGITCKCVENSTNLNNTCTVNRLILNNFNLIGSIPYSVSNFTNMTWLQLSVNALTGTIPTSISQLPQLVVLDLAYNNLTGTLPPDLGSLHFLRNLVLNSNRLNGTIPDSYNDLEILAQYTVSENLLTGTIPERITNMKHLVQLDLFTNGLTGTIPNSIHNMTRLRLLNIFNNHLSGTLPESLSEIMPLNQINVFNNSLNGTIPASYAKLVELHALNVFDNLLTGPIPVSLGDMGRSLLVLNLFDNLLTGTIPGELGQLTHLLRLDLCTNLLSSTLPASLGNLTDLLELYINNNVIYSTIPESYTHLTNLLVLYFQANFITGTLPNACGTELRNLTEVDLSGNQLTGSIPSSFGNLRLLTEFALYDNHLSGTIPAQMFENCVLISILYLSNNLLSGTLPSALGRLNLMNDLYLNQNLLSGTVPSTLTNMTGLNILFLEQNDFRGNVNAFVNSSAQRHLQHVDLSNNQFTGTLPSDLFSIKSLVSVAMVTNCIVGTIPPSLCSLPFLSVLALDGLTTATDCQMKIFPAVSASTAYALQAHITGGIPSCVFAIPSLETLHLSGNKLTGSLPEDIAISPSLLDLSLSHNRLTGTIPLQVQQREWTNLDLSYNLFSGVLSSSFHSVGNDSALSLQDNRLSGVIPTSLKNAYSIAMLHANLFSCSYYRTQLPENDPNSDIYQCGSDSFNRSVLFYGCILFFFLLVRVAVYYSVRHYIPSNSEKEKTHICFGTGKLFRWVRSMVRKIVRWMSIYQVTGTVDDLDSFVLDPNSNILMMGHVMHAIRASATIILSVVVLVIMPIYVVLTNFYKTYTYEYAWILSAAFLSGRTPAVVLFVVYSLFMVCLYNVFDKTLYHGRLTTDKGGNIVRHSSLSWASGSNNNSVHGSNGNSFTSSDGIKMNQHNDSDRHNSGSSTNTNSTNETNNNSNYNSTATQENKYRIHYTLCSLIALLNTLVVLPVNVAFVYISINYNGAVVVCAQIAIAMFKLTWSDIAVCGMIRIGSAYVNKTSDGDGDSGGTDGSSGDITAGDVRKGTMRSSMFFSTMRSGTAGSSGNSGSNSGVESDVNSSSSSNRGRARTSSWFTSTFGKKGSGNSSIGDNSGNDIEGKDAASAELDETVRNTLINSSTSVVVNPIFNNGNGFGADVKISDSPSTAIGGGGYGNTKVTTTGSGSPNSSNIDGNRKRFDTLDTDYSNTSGSLSGGSRHSVPMINHIRKVQYESNYLLFQIVLSLFNNIAVPFLATTAISSNCFYNLFVTPPLVNASYSVTQCALYYLQLDHVVRCVKEVDLVHDTTYIPPYIYSYQCSSAFVTNYGAMYVYMFAFVLFFHPACTLLTKELALCAPPHSRLHNILQSLVPAVLQPLPEEFPRTIPVLFDRDGFIVRIARNFAILVTFGVIFPPLAVVISSAIVSYTYYEQCKIGRFLLLVWDTQRENYFAYKHIVETQCMNIIKPLDHLYWLQVPFLLLFYGYFLFDIVGSSEGVLPSLWLIIPIILMPFAIYAMFRLYRYYYPITVTKDSSAIVRVVSKVLLQYRSSSIELTPSVDRGRSGSGLTFGNTTSTAVSSNTGAIKNIVQSDQNIQ